MSWFSVFQNNSLVNVLKLELPAITSKWRNYMQGVTKEELVIQTVFAKAKEGDPDSVLNVIDDFGWKQQFLMVIA
jgi:hypothetical protein